MKDHSQPKPKHDGGEKESTNRHVYIEPGVQIDLVKNLRETYETSQTENTTNTKKQLFWAKVSAGLLFIYAAIALWQGYLTKTSIDNVQRNFIKDQRAWISVNLPKNFPVLLPPSSTTSMSNLPVTFQLSDTGKTTAKKVEGDFFATILNKGEEPPFGEYGSGHPHNRIYVGAVYPNSPLDTNVLLMKYGPNAAEAITPSVELNRSLTEGKSFIILFGKINYCDVFGVKHWTTFCTGGGAGALDDAGIRKCVAYNDVDTSDAPSAECKEN